MIICSGKCANAVPPCSNTEIRLLNKLRRWVSLLKIGNLHLVYIVDVFSRNVLSCIKSNKSYGNKVAALIIYFIVVSIIMPNSLNSKFWVIINSSMAALCCFYVTSTGESRWVSCARCGISGGIVDLNCTSNNIDRHAVLPSGSLFWWSSFPACYYILDGKRLWNIIVVVSFTHILS
jgi:hypothetical protein